MGTAKDLRNDQKVSNARGVPLDEAFGRPRGQGNVSAYRVCAQVAAPVPQIGRETAQRVSKCVGRRERVGVGVDVSPVFGGVAV